MFGPRILSSISFTTKHRMVPYSHPIIFDFLVVGGGGTIGAANGGGYYSGGGGAGGMICSGQALQGGGGNAQPFLRLSVGQSLVCTPAGETAAANSYHGSQGSASTLIGSTYSFSADGGGRGAGQGGGETSSVGGSGGAGAGYGNTGGSAGTANQGYGGGNGAGTDPNAGGGGGGAGGAGTNGVGQTGGGAGLGLLWIDGNVYAYGGRGGAGGITPVAGAYAANRPSGGAPNRGAGSGSAVGNDASGGNYGGAGVVIIAYSGAQIATGGTVTRGLLGKTYHTFTALGTFLVTG